MRDVTDFGGEQQESTEEAKRAEWYISETTEIYRTKHGFFLYNGFAHRYMIVLLN